MSVGLGTEAPQFDLPGVDGQNHSLDSYADADVLVLVQSCNHCPYVQAWDQRLNAVARDYADRGVRVVAINSNDAASHPEDSFEEMQKRARGAGLRLRLPLRRAPGGGERSWRPSGRQRSSSSTETGSSSTTARSMTPRDEDSVSQQYLRDALDAVLSGQEPVLSETPPVGCTVKWK